MTREGGLILTYKIEEPQQQFFPPAISSTPTSSRPFLSVRALFRRPRALCPVHFCVRTGPHRVPGPMDPLCLYSVASCRRMSNQRPRAAERPSADDDETVEDLVLGQRHQARKVCTVIIWSCRNSISYIL